MSELSSATVDEAFPEDGPLLELDDVSVTFGVRVRFRTVPLRAVDGVSLRVERGRTLGLVGESGSGKSTVARAIVGVEQVSAGTIRVQGVDHTRSKAGARALSSSVQMIFQNPRASLDPRHTAIDAVSEALVLHQNLSRVAREQRAAELLDLVGIGPHLHRSQPKSLSGGQLQRVAIARALAVEPELLLCDEAVSALDVSVQAQIINLLVRLQRELRVAYLFISHDLAVVRHLADDVAVMYLGTIVEQGPAAEVISHPSHPYTRALVSAVPEVAAEGPEGAALLTGDIPSPLAVPSGCRFRTRCPLATDLCEQEEPQLRPVGSGSVRVACHHVDRVDQMTSVQVGAVPS
jgi:oligopeptide/dipeptide ABC transporter ATP-binding protein